MGEMQSALSLLAGNLPCCIQRVNYPIHNGKPNPKHGKFRFVGSVPCFDSEGKSLYYDTEQQAIDAAIQAGMDTDNLGRNDCNAARKEFLRTCPEYAGYCAEARAAIAKARGQS